MDTLIQALRVFVFLVTVGLGVSFVLLIAMIGTMITDDIKELRGERKTQLARAGDEDNFFSNLVTEKRKAAPHRAKHRYNPKEGSYSYSHLQRLSQKAKHKLLPADDSIFEALLQEQREVAPLF